MKHLICIKRCFGSEVKQIKQNKIHKETTIATKEKERTLKQALKKIFLSSKAVTPKLDLTP